MLSGCLPGVAQWLSIDSCTKRSLARFQSGRMPGLQALSLVGGVQEEAINDVVFSLMFLSLSQIDKNIILKKMLSDLEEREIERGSIETIGLVGRNLFFAKRFNDYDFYLYHSLKYTKHYS